MSTPLIAEQKAKTVLDLCRKHGLRIATAESCTGGLIAAALTDIACCSDVVECGFVTYSNAAKTQMIGVPARLITSQGAVSRAVAIAMAEGALQHSEADIAVAVTGIAGPDGGTENKPIGLVHMAVALRNGQTSPYEARFGNLGRDGVRLATVAQALTLIADRIRQL